MIITEATGDAWENSMNVLSPEGYYLLNGVSDAQKFLNENFIEATESGWKKTGKFVLQMVSESLRYTSFYKVIHK